MDIKKARNGMMEYWNIGYKKISFALSHHSIIPVFHYSWCYHEPTLLK